MDMIDLLYTLAAADGRDEALLGGQREELRSLYERTLIGSARPSIYLEFPLLDEPCYDVLSVIEKVEPGATFAPRGGLWVPEGLRLALHRVRGQGRQHGLRA